jgi:hypothetical protein
MVARSRAYDADADRYVRWRKGRYQARPVDLGVRYNLGLFATRELARRAVLEFWRGQRPERPRFVREREAADGSTEYAVWIHAGGRWHRLGPFPTRDAAVAARDGWLAERYGGSWRDRLVERTPSPSLAAARRLRRLRLAEAVAANPRLSDEAVADLVARAEGVRPRPRTVAAVRRWLAAYDLFAAAPPAGGAS